jgi:hypothetical protein
MTIFPLKLFKQLYMSVLANDRKDMEMSTVFDEKVEE